MGSYTTLGKVEIPSPTTYTNRRLINGTTFYYVVSATNQAGTSPNSAPLAATPILPPTFSATATAAPNPDTQGIATNATATVQCTANTLSNGSVQVLALDPGGNTVALRSFTGQNFTAGQSRQYTLSFTPAPSGTFSIAVGVLSATGQTWSWNSSAASIVVNSSLVFTSSATATPSNPAQGSSTNIALTVKETGTSSLADGNVELQVFDGGGNAVVTNVWSGQNFSAGQSHSYAYTWSVPSSQASGAYTAMIGVFDGGWDTDYYWNGDAATITVTSAESAASGSPGSRPRR